MRYIKWLYLAIWTLIYQLPNKTIAAFSTIIISTTLFFWLWVSFSQQIIVGNIQSIQMLPDGELAVLNIVMSSKTPKRVLIKTSELSENIDKYNWFIGFGKKHFKLNKQSYLVLEQSNIFSNPLSIQTNFIEIINDALNKNRKVAVVIGVVLILFALIFIQLSTAIIMGSLTFAMSWHVLNVGNFFKYWEFSDLVILPISGIIFIVGTAIGMRNTKGKSAFIFHRLAALILLIIFTPYLQSLFSVNVVEFIFWLLIPLFFYPELIITIIGSQLISLGLGLTNSENLAISLMASIITIWIHRHKYAKPKSRPFRKTKTNQNGEMVLESKHF